MKKLIFLTLFLVACGKDWQIPEGPKTVSNEFFSLSVPGEVKFDLSQNYIRIHNYEPDKGSYRLDEGEYYIEIIYSKDINEKDFRAAYNKVEDSEIADKPALFGTERNIVGDGNEGVGYLVPVHGKFVLFNISEESLEGLNNAMSLLEEIKWVD